MPGPQTTQPSGDDALLHRQLGYYQEWLSSLTQAAPQALALEDVQAALRVVVSGFLDTTSAEELRNLFEGLISANHAAAAPDKAVRSCNVQPGTPSSVVLQLRCSAEASNCLAFHGLAWNGAVLKVERPRDYKPDIAVLLGPTQPNPAVVASVASTSTARPVANGDACSSQTGNSNYVAAVRSAAQLAALPGRASASGGAPSGAPSATAAAAGSAAAGGLGPASSKGGPRDLSLPADQSKQDEVFIGGLPSNWKAQQLKELLAPYGQLKSLSVAMDAATGKNKGYAFVVFASPDMVSHAIEELDCRVVEGKILAVQRATEGKACYGRESNGGNDTGSLRDGGFIGPLHQHQPLPAAPQQHPPLQPHPQQPALHHQHPPPLLRHHHHRSSSTGSALPPHLPAPAPAGAPVDAAAVTSHAAQGPPPPGPGPFSGSLGGHGRSSNAGGAPPAGPGIMGPAPPPAVDSSVLGPRPPLAGPPSSSSASMQHHSGPSSAKQYDINELYIGDLPLTWDEDAVRRLLGRFGRIKYFTLRNGRDKNFAFCKFKDSSVVDAAIAGLHGKIVDGYFLNVRRAIEGKQQAAVQGASPQTQPLWLSGKQPPMHQQPQQQPQQSQQQQPNVRASFDATSTRATGSMHRPRMSADQQQLSKLAAAATAAGPPPVGAGPPPPVAGKGGPTGLLPHPFGGPHGLRGNVLGAGGAAGQQQDRTAGLRGEQHGRGQGGLDGTVRGPQQQQQGMHLQRELDRAKAGSPPAGAAAGGGNGSGKQEAVSGGGSAPSTPGTPTKEQSSTGAAGPGVADQQQQQPVQRGPVTTNAAALPALPSGPGLPARGYGPFTGPQLLQQPALQQLTAHQAAQQQLQQQLQLQQQQAIFQASYGAGAASYLPPGPLPPPALPGGGSAATSLFGPNGPASWPGAASLAAAALAAASPTTAAGNLVLPGVQGGAFGSGLGLKQQQNELGVQQGPATQAQSLLQTWDMLSPWSLFSQQ